MKIIIHICKNMYNIYLKIKTLLKDKELQLWNGDIIFF